MKTLSGNENGYVLARALGVCKRTGPHLLLGINSQHHSVRPENRSGLRARAGRRLRRAERDKPDHAQDLPGKVFILGKFLEEIKQPRQWSGAYSGRAEV